MRYAAHHHATLDVHPALAACHCKERGGRHATEGQRDSAVQHSATRWTKLQVPFSSVSRWIEVLVGSLLLDGAGCFNAWPKPLSADLGAAAALKHGRVSLSLSSTLNPAVRERRKRRSPRTDEGTEECEGARTRNLGKVRLLDGWRRRPRNTKYACTYELAASRRLWRTAERSNGIMALAVHCWSSGPDADAQQPPIDPAPPVERATRTPANRSAAASSDPAEASSAADPGPDGGIGGPLPR